MNTPQGITARTVPRDGGKVWELRFECDWTPENMEGLRTVEKTLADLSENMKARVLQTLIMGTVVLHHYDNSDESNDSYNDIPESSEQRTVVLASRTNVFGNGALPLKDASEWIKTRRSEQDAESARLFVDNLRRRHDGGSALIRDVFGRSVNTDRKGRDTNTLLYGSKWRELKHELLNNIRIAVLARINTKGRSNDALNEVVQQLTDAGVTGMEEARMVETADREGHKSSQDSARMRKHQSNPKRPDGDPETTAMEEVGVGASASSALNE